MVFCIGFSSAAGSGNQFHPDPFDRRVEMNLPRFSFLGSIGLPIFFGSLILVSLNPVAAVYATTPAARPRI
jgi:hypothetical protein